MPRHRIFLLLVLTPVLAGCTLLAQTLLTPEARLAQFQAFLVRRGAEVTSAQASALKDPAAWNLKRAEVRRQMLYMLGLDPMPPKTPLRARITGQFERERYRVEKIVFESMPGLYVTGDLYVPKAGRTKASGALSMRSCAWTMGRQGAVSTPRNLAG